MNRPQQADQTHRSSFIVHRSNVVLAATHHDPEGRLYEQSARVLSTLAAIFDGLAIYATPDTQERSLALLAEHSALIGREPPGQPAGLQTLGRGRRGALALGLELGAPAILFCDFDRVLHWAECYPAELAHVVAHAHTHDFTVLGRTSRAFESHPRIQRDTEAIVNQAFATLSGRDWDVTAAARTLTRRGAEAIIHGCPDETIGTDVAWPLFAARAGLTLGYIATEGLEFETADRYADEIAALGGLERWTAQIDADPRRWIERLEIARIEIEAALPYLDERPTTNDQRRRANLEA
jgi:hypothetical protein